MFKNEGLNITTEGNITVIDFLDVVLDLDTGSFKPFIKPNANTMYVSPHSNHPPSITANIPDAISKRLSSISSSKEMFDSEVEHYQNALNAAGYEALLEYKEMDTDENKNKKNRNRNVIWFNPPFSKNVKTNLGGKFLTLIRKHFPKGSELYKLFNTKKVKLAYSCCPSMKQIISTHNKKILQEEQNIYDEQGGCNCEGGVEHCPFNGNCLIENVVYKATVNSQEGLKEYIGQTMNSFKTRFSNHKSSFNNWHKKKATTLSSYIWKLKKNKIDYEISWSKEARAFPYQGGGAICNLCNMEKTLIVTNNPAVSLNRRTEIMGKCRHKWPFYLNNYHGLKVPTTVEEEVLVDEESLSEEEDEDDLNLPSSSQQDPSLSNDVEDVPSEVEEEGLHHLPQSSETDLNEGMMTRRRTKNNSNLIFYQLP